MSGPDVRRDFLVVADVSGYTAFLTGSELEHAHEIMREIMTVLSGSLGYPLQVVEHEGDAVLCCALEGGLQDPPLLLDVLEGAYVRFADHLFNVQRATTCTCRACQNVSTLDLKFIVHHGEFVLERQPAGIRVSGPDVILVHRLMKNAVGDRTGLRAYLLLTEPALERVGRPAGFTPHEERYDHFGQVRCSVADLRPTLEARRAAREIRVRTEEAALASEGIVDAAPVAVWDYYFDPTKRPQWEPGILGIRRERDDRGRPGVGARLHCAHGRFKTLGTTVDWKPFRYFTVEYVAVEGFVPFPTPMLVSLETEPLPDGRTRVRLLCKPRGRNVVKRTLMALMRKQIERQGNAELERLNTLLRADRQVSSAATGPA
jgi:hypothetical protein